MRTSLRAGSALILAIAAAGVPASRAAASPGDLDLVSRASGATSAKGDAESRAPSVSGDGRLVAFSSDAASLHPDDTDGTGDIFVRNLETQTTTLVSRASGAAGAKGNGNSSLPAISANGRFVAFFTVATNLYPRTPPGIFVICCEQILVRDLAEQTTILASPGGADLDDPGANGNSVAPSISADGRFVAFESDATDLAPGDTDTWDDVYVRDLQAGTTTLVSRASGAGGAKGDEGNSVSASISADGRFVAFTSFALGLHPDDTDHEADVYVRDLEQQTTTLVSRAGGASGAKGDYISSDPSISADGRAVAFTSSASNLVPGLDAPGTPRVYVRDLQAHTTTLGSRAAGAQGTVGAGQKPSISADGRSVAFTGGPEVHSGTPQLSGSPNVFVRDLRAQTTTLVSRPAGTSGATSEGGSANPSISADGGFVAFDSEAADLHPDDTDRTADVFRRELEASVGVVTGALRMNRRRRVTIRLACTAGAGDCLGRVRIITRNRLRVAGASRVARRTRRVTLAAKRFTIAAGKTRKVRLRLGRRKARLVRNRKRARKVLVVATVSQAGNRTKVRRKAKLRVGRARRSR